MNETLKTIQQRSSCRSFKSKNISDQELKIILESALQAPSSKNKQTCEVYAVTKRELIDKLSQEIKNVYQSKHSPKDNDYYFGYHAPTIIIVCGPEYNNHLIEEGSCMLENMMLASTSLGIGSCWIDQLRDTQDFEKIHQYLMSLGIPSNYQVAGCIAVGYPKEITKVNRNMNRIHII